MSNAVLPALAGLAFPVEKTPMWSTVIQEAASGKETRLGFWSYPKWKYSLAYDVLRSDATAELQQLLGFFNARQGAFDDWLFDDPDDNAITGQTLGIGNGVTTTFTIARAYGGYVEPIGQVKDATFSVAGIPAVNFFSPNGGMEVDTNADGLANGWSIYSSGSVGTVTASGTAGVSSTRAQRISSAAWGATTNDQAGIVFATNIPAVDAQPFAMAADVRDSGNLATVRFYVDWYNVANTIIGNSSASFAGSNSVNRRTATFVAPAGVSYGKFYIFGQAATGGPTAVNLDIDNAQLQYGGTATAFSDYYASIVSANVVQITPAPANAAVVTWTGGYYWRCRFMDDQITASKFMKNLWDMRALEFVSVK